MEKLPIDYEEFCKLYNEACDCRDWLTCDILSDDYPEYAKEMFSYVEGDTVPYEDEDM